MKKSLLYVFQFLIGKVQRIFHYLGEYLILFQFLIGKVQRRNKKL